MSAHNEEFYRSRAWRTTRHAYKQSKGNLCERCLAKGMITPAEMVHHKIPLTDDNIKDLDISLGWNNLQALCRKCHAEVHSELEAEKTGKRYTIDSVGRIILRDE